MAALQLYSAMMDISRGVDSCLADLTDAPVSLNRRSREAPPSRGVASQLCFGISSVCPVVWCLAARSVKPLFGSVRFRWPVRINDGVTRWLARCSSFSSSEYQATSLKILTTHHYTIRPLTLRSLGDVKAWWTVMLPTKVLCCIGFCGAATSLSPRLISSWWKQGNIA